MFRTHSGDHTDKDFLTTGILGEDKCMTDNVHYSLNKQRRWELPEVIEDLILSGKHDEEYNFQLVQRHNIFRTANCVSVAATNGVFHGGQVTKDRLFKIKNSGSFFQSNSVLNVKVGQSRQNRRARRQQHLRQEEENEPEEQVDVPHIRYEVVHPTPDTSFLAYNPKSVGIETRKPFVWSGYQDKHSRSKKRTRLFRTINDMMDEQVDDFSDEEQDFENNCDTENTVNSNTLTFDDVMKHASKASDLLSGRKVRNNSSSSNSSGKEISAKRQVIYIEKDDINVPMTESTVRTGPTNTAMKRHHIEMQAVKVVLPHKQTLPERLTESYGGDYIEADCFPRKFLLNISNKVQPSKKQNVCVFLVFVLDVDSEMNTQVDSVFNVLVNAHFKGELQSVKLETVFDYSETNIDELIKRTVFYFETLPVDALEIEESSIISCRSKTSQVEMCAHWSTKSYYPSSMILINELSTCTHTEPEELGFEMVSPHGLCPQETLDVSSPQGQFCAICFEELGLLNGTALISCSHWFCDNCWREHVYTQIDNGAMTLQCPEYGCKCQVDVGTLMSLASMCDVIRYARFNHDNQVQVQAVRRWCPNNTCGRVVEVNGLSANFAQCDCGLKFCMQCMQKSHWPASCEAVRLFTNKLKKTGDISLLPEEATTTCSVNGKNCPMCNRFVEKNGGCPFMYYVCGKAFCWGCGQSWSSRTHDTKCYTQGTKNNHGTKKYQIKPDRIEDKKREPWYKMAVKHRLYQHPIRMSKLKRNIREITKKLQTYIFKSQQKGLPVTLDFDTDNKRYSSEVDKVFDWLKNSMDMYVEISHVIENAAVLLGFTQLTVSLKRRLQFTINRLAFFAESIHSLIRNGVTLTSPPAIFLNTLKEARSHSKQCIQILLKFFKQLNLQ